MFDGLEKEEKRVTRAILSGVGTTSKNKAKRAYKSMLGMRTGNLYRSIKRKVTKDGKHVVISSEALSLNNKLYGYALAKGSTITAKNGEYLTFKVNDQWVKVKSVKLPEKDFISDPIKKYIDSPAYERQIDKILDKQLEKLEKKGYKIKHL